MAKIGERYSTTEFKRDAVSLWETGAEGDADVVVVGGGPAGLTAAIYLARFHLRTIIVDDGNSRALQIPVSHNHAGHPAGISGRTLVDRMRAQALQYGARLVDAAVDALGVEAGGFAVEASGTLRARAVLLATGVRNNRPPISETLHAEALARGLLRYCPVCDGFEVTDKRIGVIGTGGRGASEALFLRSFSRDVTLIAPDAAHRLDDEQAAALAEAGVAVIGGPASDFTLSDTEISVATAMGPQRFDTIYPALGSQVHSALARRLGADLGESGAILVDDHQRTSIKGLYAAGDVVLGLDQISHAMGEAGVAATAIRNDLAAVRPMRR